MKKITVLFFLVSLPFIGVKASEQKAYEMPRTQVVPIQDTKNDRQYELYIRLPEGYAENTNTHYPVIFAADAVWHMDMLSGATEYLMPNVIVVGISWQKGLDDERAHVSRYRDYSIEKSSNPVHQAKYQFGQASNHLPFIRANVIPYVENNYRTDPDERAYFGYSLSGTFGVYVLFEQSDTFKHYILGSPTPQIAGFIDMHETKPASQQQDLNVNVFVAIGELEKDKMEMTEGFASILQRRSEASLTFSGLEVIEGSNHGTAFPETVIRSIKWLSQQIAE
ncbi:alpha/beta hydrolase [Kordiimonas aquimaris]|uniref:alpha/beta hydrolase n=1 Tax=Kordiimonas aquimaris TaxID=707591 RepID=UPI0021D37C33|nr:alpha/beta hydrolase-fold protein [Kordiimonas aquimaris]